MSEILINAEEVRSCVKYKSGKVCIWLDGVKEIREVPTHGDLIERSSVYNVLDDRVALYKEVGDEYNACNIACIEGDIVAIPTIIEASKEREC